MAVSRNAILSEIKIPLFIQVYSVRNGRRHLLQPLVRRVQRGRLAGCRICHRIPQRHLHAGPHLRWPGDQPAPSCRGMSHQLFKNSLLQPQSGQLRYSPFSFIFFFLVMDGGILCYISFGVRSSLRLTFFWPYTSILFNVVIGSGGGGGEVGRATVS